ncbi:MAG: tRNA 2-thiouridine(34) synthase MnmA [Candidatus Saccharibacteria bacterium]|nr:tRNA 2-thiouridine(34) synthase MnmA [Candidatus Saccharibacteria bacterium]
MSKSTVFVGMSGGVDSSVSAKLLLDQGYQVVGVYMKNWSRDLPGMKCPWAEDLADAKRVAVKLGIDFRVFDFETEYKQKVVDYMLAEFKQGRTPNPDIMCNQEIKFKLFYEVAREQGADLIATGHYARVLSSNSSLDLTNSSLKISNTNLGLTNTKIEKTNSTLNLSNNNIKLANTSFGQKAISKTPQLLLAADNNKDQTYFLYRISAVSLAHTIFPLGNLTKPEVKKLAEQFGFANAYKKESMGVCFVGEANMKDFLRDFLPEKYQQPGKILDFETGEFCGYHDGAVFYTLGQRHGLDIGGGLPYYVVKKDMKNNLVYVSRNLQDKNLWTKELILEDVFFRETPPRNIRVRLRHRGELLPAIYEAQKLIFPEKTRRPASGQSAVIYDGETCLGGGIIL